MSKTTCAPESGDMVDSSIDSAVEIRGIQVDRPTPGPWYVADARAVVPCAVISNSGMVAKPVWGRDCPPNLGEVQANARLIAAAPETTEALGRALNDLEAALPTLRLAGWDTTPQEETVRQGRAAFAKATGGAQ